MENLVLDHLVTIWRDI